MTDDVQPGKGSSAGMSEGEQIAVALNSLPSPMVVALKQLMVSFGFPSTGTVNEMPPGAAPALTAIADAFYGSSSHGRGVGSPDGGIPPFPNTPPLPPPPPGVITG
ncbi:hypothetical protein [Streptomyces sp. NPDC051577]|uniref:hypothetical protein n=1 Tax=Streptomyces sp. NPDC051577 TaxID=3155166 RepID=UPI0034451B94